MTNALDNFCRSLKMPCCHQEDAVYHVDVMTAIAVTIYESRALRTALLCRAYQAERPRRELAVADIDESGLQVQQERMFEIRE
jgi:hypothetical protein